VNAASSACEMQPLFDRFRGERPVYAPDLPGFGFSDRSARAYSPDLYASALIEFAERQIADRDDGLDVIALSLSSEFAAIAAALRPDLFHSLVFMSPTGFDRTQGRGGSEKARRAWAFPLWSQAFFDLLVSRPSIRYYLQKSFAGAVDPRLARYAFLTAHQPGARRAPLYFLSGHLFTPNIRDIYRRLNMPVMVVANEDGYVRFDALPGFAAEHPSWRIAHIAEARSLPHFENPAETSRVIQDFWRHLPDAPVPTSTVKDRRLHVDG
jgi:pimeloyl-ACP methyl ester carboxylesterase